MADTKDTTFDSILSEARLFPPPADFAKKSHVASFAEYQKIYDQAKHHPEEFWAGVAENIHWFKKFDSVLQWDPPDATWFKGGKTNVSYNCIDRHVLAGKKDHLAILWEGEPGEIRKITFAQLQDEVSRFANVLKDLGVKLGDRVTVYMPMVPELAFALLACARLGAVHNVVFGGFSVEALRERINDSQSKVVVTADGGFRRGKIVELKSQVDLACAQCACVEKVVVLKRAENPVSMQPSRDVWWHDFVPRAATECPAVALDSEHPLFILYTSGTTGKPKGIVHTTAGYLVNVTYTSKLIFDLKRDDIYWCTADIGWVTGHSYVLYGILSNGVTTLMYEGAPNHPHPGRFWEVIDKHQVNIFYTAPTAIRAFMKWGDAHPLRYSLASLRLLGSVGEPINPEAWMWYHEVIGKKKCPIVDTWWQTETGAIAIAPLPGAVATKPGSATFPLPGIVPEIVDESGQPVPKGKGGLLVIKSPWPSMLRGIYGDPERFKKQYFEKFPGKYFTGDGVHQDQDGYFWIMGRVDDVLKVAGHRLGTMEIESALVSHPAVVEAAVVGKPDDLKGQAIVAFVTLDSAHSPSPALEKEIIEHVGKEIGAIAKPEHIRFTDALPKTRSGKIMRRLLGEIATKGKASGDKTTLEDIAVLDALNEEV